MKLLKLILLLLFPLTGWCQYNVFGTITDQSNNLPLRGVTVFIDGSSYATLTDSSGHFEFQNLPVKVVDLVAAKPGFTTGIYRTDVKTSNLKIIFQLGSEDEQTDNTTNDSLSASLQKWSEVFLSSFIGTSANSYDCYIANPKVLRFKYADSLDGLSVTATEPLQIFNEALGYIVYYYLSEVFIKNNGVVYNSSFHYFKELKSKQPLILSKWKLNRYNAYNGSLLHFMRSFYNNKLNEEGFRVRKVNRIYEDDASYARTKKIPGAVAGKTLMFDSLGKPFFRFFTEFVDKTALPVDEYRQSTDNDTWLIPSSSALEITYLKSGKPLVSFIILKGQRLLVESNGLYFDSADLLQEGFWKSLKVADALPCNFERVDL